MAKNTCAIIAGASGLVGNELIHQLLSHPDFSDIYSLSRRTLPLHSNKLHQIVDTKLRVTDWSDEQPRPTVGFICLGTTIKQAGNKQALADVDLNLVKQVAETMKLLGVQHIIVISSIFACTYSPFHYLRCKGHMEAAVKKLGFDKCSFIRPGPLQGDRDVPRKGELFALSIMNLFKPLAFGPIKHLMPIQAEDVATTMINMSQSKHPSETVSGHHIWAHS